MNEQGFKETLLDNYPPSSTSVYLKSLWFDAKGDWNNAHNLIQDVTDNSAAWIHPYLHRKEGDIWNADYWYSKAGKKRPSVSLDEEWEQLLNAFL